MARRERFVNNASTTLASGLTNIQTSMTVDDGSVFPTEGDFRLRLNDEIVICTARSGNVLTISRGEESTTAASHDTGTVVRAILTAGGIDAFMYENPGIYLPGSSGTPACRLSNASGAVLNASSFTAINFESIPGLTNGAGGSVTLEDDTSGAGSDVRAAVISAPTAPWTFIWGGYGTWRNSGGSVYPQGGACVRDSTSGELILSAFHCRETDFYAHEIAKMNSPTSYNSSPVVLNPTTRGPVWWTKIEDDNTDLAVSVSYDGVNWIELWSETRTTFLTPDQIGFFFNRSSNNSGVSQWLITRHFSVE